MREASLAVFSSLYSKWSPGSKREIVEQCVRSEYFDLVFSMAIVINFIVMMFEAQYKGTQTGYTLGYPGINHTAGDTFPGAEEWWRALDWVFGIIFSVELVMKLTALRCEFFRSWWNLFDFFVVGLWWVGKAGTNVPVPPMMLRVARMAKLLRLLKVVRTVQAFDSLFILTHSLKASVSATAWSLLLLFLVEALTGVCLGYALDEYVRDTTKPLVKRMEVFKYYGTFTRSLLTMFELTLGNWIPPTRAVTENVTEWYMPLFLLHKLFIGFVVIRVISGVFLHQTFNVASQDDEAMMRTEVNQVKTHTMKIQRLFRHMDLSGDGLLDEKEFNSVLLNSDVHTWLSAMGLTIRDGEEAFRLLQKHPGAKLTAHDLVAGTARLKGSARSIDLASAKQTIGMLNTKIDQLCDAILDPGRILVLKESSPLLAPGLMDDALRMFSL